MKAWKGRQGKSDGKEEDDKERTVREGWQGSTCLNL